MSPAAQLSVLGKRAGIDVLLIPHVGTLVQSDGDGSRGTEVAHLLANIGGCQARALADPLLAAVEVRSAPVGYC